MKACSLPKLSPRFLSKAPEPKIQLGSELLKEAEENYFIPALSEMEKLAYSGQESYSKTVSLLRESITEREPQDIRRTLDQHLLGLLYWHIAKNHELAKQAFSKVRVALSGYGDLRRRFETELVKHGFSNEM